MSSGLPVGLVYPTVPIARIQGVVPPIMILEAEGQQAGEAALLDVENGERVVFLKRHPGSRRVGRNVICGSACAGSAASATSVHTKSFWFIATFLRGAYGLHVNAGCLKSHTLCHRCDDR